MLVADVGTTKRPFSVEGTMPSKLTQPIAIMLVSANLCLTICAVGAPANIAVRSNAQTDVPRKEVPAELKSFV